MDYDQLSVGCDDFVLVICCSWTILMYVHSFGMNVLLHTLHTQRKITTHTHVHILLIILMFRCFNEQLQRNKTSD